MLKKTLLVIFSLGVLSLAYFFIIENKKQNTAATQTFRFFTPLSIAHFTFGDLPCVNVEIEGKQMLVNLNLGFTGCISLLKEVS